MKILKEVQILANNLQIEVRHYLEQVLNHLTKNVNISSFESQIKSNVEQKKKAAVTEKDFYISLVMNMEYFHANKMAWQDIFQECIVRKELNVMYIERELLAEQMKIRQVLHEQKNLYLTKMQQFISENMEFNQLIRNYVQASIEHSLRIDLLTILAMNKHSNILYTANFEMIINYLNEQIQNQVTQIVSKMTLS